MLIAFVVRMLHCVYYTPNVRDLVNVLLLWPSTRWLKSVHITALPVACFIIVRRSWFTTSPLISVVMAQPLRCFRWNGQSITRMRNNPLIQIQSLDSGVVFGNWTNIMFLMKISISEFTEHLCSCHTPYFDSNALSKLFRTSYAVLSFS